jgi:hypothetical protein
LLGNEPQGLETDEAVREAAYGYQADAELSR